MTKYAHVRDGRIVALQDDAGYRQTHASVRHLWQQVPDDAEVGATDHGLPDAPYMHPVVSVGEFIACWHPQELRDLYASESLDGADPDIADFAHRLRAHIASNTGIDRNSAILQSALDKMTKTKVPGSKRTYLTPERRDQIMAAIRL